MVPRRQPGLWVALILTLVYLAFPTRQYYWDGVAFSIMIEHAQNWRELFNVHHLLYDFIGYAGYKVLGGGVRALYLLQWTNCAAGGLLVWLQYRLFRSLDVPAGNSAACAAICGAAATFWKFTTDADSYILTNVFLVAAWLALRRSLVRGAMLHICAGMMHQLAVIFYPAALALIWQRSRERFWRDAAIYTAVSGGGLIAAYAAAYRLVPRPEAGSLSEWLTYHSQIPFSFQVWKNAWWVLLGTARLFAGGKLSAAAAAAGVAALALLAAAARDVIRKREAFQPVRKEWPLAVWAGGYLCFLFFWEPYNTFYRLFYLAPLVALLAAATRGLRARPLALAAAALACWNFVAFIYPNTRVESNQPLAFALRQRPLWPPGTAIIFAKFVPDLWTISYFNPQVIWISMDRPDAARVAGYVDQIARDGRRVYLDWTYMQALGEAGPRFAFRAAESRPEPRQ